MHKAFSMLFALVLGLLCASFSIAQDSNTKTAPKSEPEKKNELEKLRDEVNLLRKEVNDLKDRNNILSGQIESICKQTGAKLPAIVGKTLQPKVNPEPKIEKVTQAIPEAIPDKRDPLDQDVKFLTKYVSGLELMLAQFKKQAVLSEADKKGFENLLAQAHPIVAQHQGNTRDDFSTAVMRLVLVEQRYRALLSTKKEPVTQVPEPKKLAGPKTTLLTPVPPPVKIEPTQISPPVKVKEVKIVPREKLPPPSVQPQKESCKYFYRGQYRSVTVVKNPSQKRIQFSGYAKSDWYLLTDTGEYLPVVETHSESQSSESQGSTLVRYFEYRGPAIVRGVTASGWRYIPSASLGCYRTSTTELGTQYTLLNYSVH